MSRSRRRLAIGVLFGGRSAEHEVSLVSATSIIAALDRTKYAVVPIGIDADGTWRSAPGLLRRMKARRAPGGMAPCALSLDPRRPGLVGGGRVRRLDALFPVLHGTFGEDGTLQGLLELAGIPYVGSGVLGSAAGMDKVVTKQLCEGAGIAVAPYLWYVGRLPRAAARAVVARVERELGYPAFVKPANSGSSVGISKAHDRGELVAAMRLAERYDRKILIERAVAGAREIEVSVLGNDDPRASVPGEIVSSNEFYDYDAKYVDGRSEAVIPAALTARQRREIMDLALRGYRAIDAAGMARVDFLLPRRPGGRPVLNEINTIPGFTSISMYPKLWEASGLSYPRLLDRLIALAIARHRAMGRLQRVYTPKSDWYAG